MGSSFNPDKTISTITRFIADQLHRSGLNGYVIGLSGGVDSALSAALAVKAVGPDKLYGLLMPHRISSKSSVTDALELVKQLGISHKQVDITPMVDAYLSKIDDSNAVRTGNKMARERMSVLYDIAFEMNRLVLGTGNRSEFCLGYTTLHGDSACSVNPLGELYKTEVRILAQRLGLPESILTKPPSADLWADQTDEGEIGVTYEIIDRLLMRIIDDGVSSMSQLESEGYEAENIKRVVSLLNRNYFKRRPPDVASLGRPAVPDRIQIDN